MEKFFRSILNTSGSRFRGDFISIKGGRRNSHGNYHLEGYQLSVRLTPLPLRFTRFTTRLRHGFDVKISFRWRITSKLPKNETRRRSKLCKLTFETFHPSHKLWTQIPRWYKFSANSLIEISLNFAICGANLRGKVEGKQGETRNENSWLGTWISDFVSSNNQITRRSAFQSAESMLRKIK